jgi:nicotinamidase-related amidase
MTVRLAAAGAALFLAAAIGAPAMADVITDWNKAVIPPPPPLKDVTVDPSTTALLILDMMKTGCSRRELCKAAFPNVQRLHDAARAHNMMIWYSLVGSNGKATPDDVYAPSIKPRDGEWFRQGGADKFLGSTLGPYLEERGIKTVIICGTSFQGATVGTATAATQRGYKVIVPVDCSSSEDEYHEQYATYHLGVGGPARVTDNVTLTRSTMIKY